MNTGVVHELDATALQRRREELFDISFEHFTGRRAFEHERAGNAIVSQLTDIAVALVRYDGRILAMTTRLNLARGKDR